MERHVGAQRSWLGHNNIQKVSNVTFSKHLKQLIWWSHQGGVGSTTQWPTLRVWQKGWNKPAAKSSLWWSLFPIYEGEAPQTPEFIYEKMSIYSYTFKLLLPPKYSPFDTIHLLRCFSTALNSVWTHRFWCLSMLPPFFVSSLPYQPNVSLWGLFHLGKQTNKKSHSQGDQLNRESRAQGSCHFLVKNCWALSVVGTGTLINHPSWKGKMCLESSKKVHWSRTQPLTTTPIGTLIQMGSYNTH